MNEEQKAILLKMIHSIVESVEADSPGDVLEACYEGASRLGVDVPESLACGDDIRRWLKSNGVTEGIWA